MAKAKQIVLVSAESIDKMLSSNNRAYRERVVGKALIALLQRQTQAERSSAVAMVNNGIGFTGADAHSATLTAKYFQKWGNLQDWQLDAWTRIAKNGKSRLAKYHKQLNQIAVEKQQESLPI